MHFLFTIFLCSVLAQLSPIYAQAPIKVEEITKKIEAFTESESAMKEKWETLLKHRKSRNIILEEAETLNKSNNALTSIENQTLKPIKLEEVSSEISSPKIAQITERVSKIKQLEENLEAQQELLNSSLALAESRQKIILTEITKIQSELTILKTSPEPTSEIDSFINQEIIAKLESNSNKLKLELINKEKQIPILKRNLQTIAKDIERITTLYNQWSDQLIKANKNAAASIKEEIEQLANKLSDDSPAKEIAEQTIMLSNSLLSKDNIHTELRDIRKELAKLNQTQLRIDEQHKYAQDRISLLKKAKLSIDRETGTLLRKQRSELRTEKDLQLRLTSIFQDSTRNELVLLEEREHLETISAYSTDSYEESLTAAQQFELTEEEFLNLIESAEKLHEIVISERDNLSKEYRKLVPLLQTTINSSKKYSLFIDKELLWIISHPPIGKQSFIEEMISLKTLYSPTSLSQLFTSWQLDASKSPIIWVLFFLIISGVLLLRKKLYRWAKEAHQSSAKNNCNTFAPTLIGLFNELMLVLPIPLLLAFLSWRMPSELPLQAGLQIGSYIFLVLGLIRRICKRDGFLESNSIVSTGHLKLFRKAIRALYIILPLVLITATSLTEINAELTQGRLFNMLSLITMAAVMHYILLPKKRLLSGKKNPGFLSYLAYITFVIFPLALVVVAASGYYISMLTLKMKLIYTIRVILLIVFVSALLKRWLLVTRRKALMNVNQTAITDPDSALTEQEKKQEIQETVTKVSEQSSKLIRVAATVILVFSLLAIWSKTLPALSVLDDIRLWETTSSEASETSKSSSSMNPLSALSGSTETTADTSQTKTSFISLQDLLVTFIVSFLTYLAAVNIPSLLQITILNHLKLKHGTAFTITTAIRYVIIIVGIIWAFGSIGVTWNKIQWLAAAITLGIGFGLQEIFANFVAGLILLFERPIRIGDIITVGDINGKVTKIQMRATTILQFNNRELIIPNKEFITGQLVNWTLSDNIIRADVPVGIAYGSDTALAKSIMLKCADQNKRSLKEPMPDVIFNAFGDSSLNFVLRVFISSIDDLMPIISEMHFAIDNAFREAKIEIAFPQQDIHIRTIDAIFPIQNKEPATD